MYTYEKWDRKSKVNGVTPEQVLSDLRNTHEEIYLIKNERGETCQIQTESLPPRNGETIEEFMQATVDEMNAAELTQAEQHDSQANEIIKLKEGD